MLKTSMLAHEKKMHQQKFQQWLQNIFSDCKVISFDCNLAMLNAKTFCRKGCYSMAQKNSFSIKSFLFMSLFLYQLWFIKLPEI
jgi:hypothetical protein